MVKLFFTVLEWWIRDILKDVYVCVLVHVERQRERGEERRELSALKYVPWNTVPIKVSFVDNDLKADFVTGP